MKATHLKTFALCLLGLVVAGGAFASNAPVPYISGTGISAPGENYGINVSAMWKCIPTTIDNGLGVYDAGPWVVKQSFTPTKTAKLVGVGVGMSMNGFSTVNIYCELYTDNGNGFPGSLLSTSKTKTVNNPPSWPSYVKVPMPWGAGGPTLSAGTSYVALFKTVGSACFIDGNYTSDPCAGGSWDQSLDNGITWQGWSGDLGHLVAGRAPSSCQLP